MASLSQQDNENRTQFELPNVGFQLNECSFVRLNNCFLLLSGPFSPSSCHKIVYSICVAVQISKCFAMNDVAVFYLYLTAMLDTVDVVFMFSKLFAPVSYAALTLSGCSILFSNLSERVCGVLDAVDFLERLFSFGSLD